MPKNKLRTVSPTLTTAQKWERVDDILNFICDQEDRGSDKPLTHLESYIKYNYSKTAVQERQEQRNEVSS